MKVHGQAVDHRRSAREVLQLALFPALRYCLYARHALCKPYRSHLHGQAFRSVLAHPVRAVRRDMRRIKVEPLEDVFREPIDISVRHVPQVCNERWAGVSVFLLPAMSEIGCEK